MLDLAPLVSRLAQLLLSGEPFEERLPAVLERIGRAYEASVSVCHLGDDESWREFRWEAERAGSPRRPFDAQPWLSSPASSDPEARRFELPGRGESGHGMAVCLRLTAEEALHLMLIRGEPFTAEELDGLTAVATTVALGGSRSAMQRAAIFDACTGLYNRRYLEEALEHELERAKRYRIALTLLIVDIDHFKEINDTLGHLAGDRVLAEVAECLLASTRSCDTIVRYGGDEFVILLPGTTLSGAKRVAGRVQERVHALAGGGKRKKIRVSLSGGAAAVHSRTTGRRLLRAADQNLYEAKRLGRDRIVFPDRRVPELSPQLNLLASVRPGRSRRRASE